MNESAARTHIQVIGWINIILGIPGILIGLAFGASLAALFAQVFPPLIPWTSLIGILIAVYSGFGVIVGFGLLNYAPWSRVLAIVLSILHLFGAHTLGVATLFGIYSIWALFQPETEWLFEHGGSGARRFKP